MNSLNEIFIFINNNLYILYFILLIFSIASFIVVISKLNKKIKNITINNIREIPINVEIDIAILEIIINNYKTNTYDPALTSLRKFYGITADNKYISVEGYTDDVNKLRRDCTLDIINTHIAEPLRSNLNKYFTDESLLLYILNKFVEV